jgi:hypothetical protein
MDLATSDLTTEGIVYWLGHGVAKILFNPPMVQL